MAEITRYGLLNAVPRPKRTALADLAARVCGVSSAFISVITDNELHQLAAVGFEGLAVPRAQSAPGWVGDEPTHRRGARRTDRPGRDHGGGATLWVELPAS